jgi:broad specificity phosphatase PhoE
MRAVVIDIDHYRMQQETRLYFIRHGETDYNRRRIVQGRRINCGLNATGRVQARALAARMASVPVDAIYTSTLLRAQETASHIAERHPKAPLYALADLEEMSWGIYEGEPLSEAVLEAFDEMHARWARDEYMHRIEGGESILDVQARGLRAVEHILHRHVGEVVAVVTHGRFLRVLLASLLEEYGLARMQDIQHANTGVNELCWQGGRFYADRLNCTVHLDRVDTILIE